MKTSQNIFNQFVHKLLWTFIRFIDIIRLLPLRLWRLLQHFRKGLQAWTSSPISIFDKKTRFQHWWIECVVLLLDCCGISEIYETTIDFVKFNTRPLTAEEKEIAYSVFGDSIHYHRVRLDNYAYAGPKQGHFCYVSFHTINSWGDMNNSILIHELVHVWQYEKLGAVYIPRALRAQYTSEGYNYGGVAALKNALIDGKGLLDFNFEQQGDIISDYYRIREGFAPRWGCGEALDLWVYERFVADLN